MFSMLPNTIMRTPQALRHKTSWYLKLRHHTQKETQNFINSMVTAIVSRKREFAVIQSVGMTKKQLNRMLVNEGLFYAVLTLVASYLLSSLAVGVVVRAMVEGGFTTFRFTLLPLAVCTPILLAFAILIPYRCFRNLEKHSIVERLRME